MVRIDLKTEEAWDLWKKLTRALIRQKKTNTDYMKIFIEEYEKR